MVPRQSQGLGWTAFSMVIVNVQRPIEIRSISSEQVCAGTTASCGDGVWGGGVDSGSDARFFG
jgi:hypothetical protein